MAYSKLEGIVDDVFDMTRNGVPRSRFVSVLRLGAAWQRFSEACCNGFIDGEDTPREQRLRNRLDAINAEMPEGGAKIRLLRRWQ
jgi:hypothetical protein